MAQIVIWAVELAILAATQNEEASAEIETYTAIAEAKISKFSI